MSRLTNREKTLATIVGAAVAILLNLFLLNFFFRNQRQLSTEMADAAAELEGKKILLAEKAIWEQRDAWLQEKLPKLANEGSGGVQLLDQVKEVAKKHSVLIENPAIGTPDRRAHVLAVTVNIETKSPWPGLIAFLRDLQGPEQFVVLETARIQKDTGDATQMRGRFRIGKWFAPR
jgi:hypothetical protein